MKKIFLFLSLFLLTACGQQVTASKESTTIESESSSTTTSSTIEEEASKSTTPTLFIHGYDGGTYSFSNLIQRMEDNGIAQKEMTITVLADGTIQTDDHLTGEATNPMIQVLFEDNQSHEWNQAEWIHSVLAYLKETENIQTVYLVGHSMGGVSSFRFLGTYPSDQTLPTVQKFTAIGAPFNDFVDTGTSQSIDDLLANGPSEFSDRLNDFYTFAPSISVPTIQLIAGQISDTDLSDGTVPLGSALAIYHLMQEQGTDISYTIIHENAQHSQLHENSEVDQLLQQFLWE